ncbi:MAG: hypothetical protein J6Y94_08445 [Bacteriovoracaceae bacterium]|nr:hypothetical protein [Bacteriovoracaceae bacterium]
MLNKNVDRAVIGRSYWSFVYAIERLKHGEKVLLLDDDRIHFGGEFANSLGLLECCLLRLWGKQSKIKALENLSAYLRPQEVNLVVGQQRIILGEGPVANLQEILRKFKVGANYARNITAQVLYNPQFLRNFGDSFLPYLQSLAAALLRRHPPSVREMVRTMPAELKMIFNLFRGILLRQENLEQQDFWAIKTLFYHAQAYLQKRLSWHLAQGDFFFLLLAMLAPRYQVDAESLMADLGKVFQEQGGQFKQTRVREWLFDHDCPWSMELASYEGIIHPHFIALLGSNIESLHLALGPAPEVYQGLTVEFKCRQVACPPFWHKCFVFSALENVGTDIPLWSITPEEDKITCQAFFGQKKGSKISFVRPQLTAFLRQQIQNFLPVMPEILEEILALSPELLAVQDLADHHPLAEDNLAIVDTSEEPRSLRKVDYFGPRQHQGLGPLSTLLRLYHAAVLH